MLWRRPGPVSGLGLGLAGGLLLLVLASIGALISAAGSGYGTPSHTTAYIRHVAGFTFFQAALSAILALALALPVARSCWRRASSWNTNLLILFAFLPVVMPTTVAATGLIGVWGQRGIISQLLQSAGAPSLPPVYGLGAVLLAHVFFNAPLMLRVLSGALGGIPQRSGGSRPSGGCQILSGSGRSNGRRSNGSYPGCWPLSSCSASHPSRWY